jgi:hypothetical protein
MFKQIAFRFPSLYFLYTVQLLNYQHYAVAIRKAGIAWEPS